MSTIFEKRRARLLAMKAYRDHRILASAPPVKCPKCGVSSPQRQVADALYVCPKCGHHFPVGAYYRLSSVLDPGSFRELNGRITAGDPLHFPGYRAKLEKARQKTGLEEAVVTATGTIGGEKCVVGVI